MKLEQTTLFGVRGERIRIKKSSPLAKIAVGETVDFHLRIGGEVTSAGHTVTEVWLKPNNFGCDVARISGRSGWVATAALTRADGTLNTQRSTLNAQVEQGAEKDPCDGCPRVGVVNCLACIKKGGERGEATGCGLVALLVLAAAIAAAALVIDRRGVSVRVAWLTEYPDPVCERCGKVLDGTGAACAEEGR